MGNNKEKYYRMDIEKYWERNRKISIVMPVYNTGEYLRQSLDSLVNQTFKDFELICVDDASVDVLTKSILEEYRQKYNFIQVIYLNTNTGAGEARNIGFGRTSGEYVSFLDADDVFHPRMLEIMYNNICRKKADVCICGYKYICSENETEKFDEVIVKPRKYDKEALSEDWLLFNSPNPWTKLCKRSFLSESNIRFQPIPACNDVYWSCMVQIKAKKVCFVEGEEILIQYQAIGHNQITLRKSVLSIYDAMTAVVQRVVGEHLSEETMNAVILLFMWLEVGEIRRAQDKEKIKECHCMTRQYLLDKVKNVSYKSVFYNGLLYSFMQPDFIERCFPWQMTFVEQLYLNEKRLLMLLNQAEKVVLWGNGKRGEAFQKFCIDHNIKLWGVADLKNTNIHKKTEYGYEIISIEEALYYTDMVVAGNTKVFHEAGKKAIDQILINLQDFCPFG